MKKTGAAMGDLEGQIYLVHNFSSRKTSSSFCSTGDREYTLDNLGSDLERSSMVWSQQQCSGRMLKSFFVNIVLNPLVQLGIEVELVHVSMLQWALLARHCEAVAVAQNSSCSRTGRSWVRNRWSSSFQSLSSVLLGVSPFSLMSSGVELL